MGSRIATTSADSGSGVRPALRLVSGFVLVYVMIVGSCSSEDRSPTSSEMVHEFAVAPDLTIDGYAAEFVPITWLGVSPAGELAVIQSQDHTIQFFDNLGRRRASVGRDGEGPGEFPRPIRGGWIGDTVWISDTQLGRVTLISPNHEVIRTFQSPGLVRPRPEDADRVPTYSYATPYAVYPGDTTMVIALRVAEGPASDPEAGTPLLRVSPSGLILVQVVPIPTNPIPTPLPAYRDWAVSSDGSRVAILTNELDAALPPTFRIEVIGAQGQSLIDRTFPYDRIPIAEAIRDSLIAIRTSVTAPARRADLESRLRAAAPSFYPGAERVVLGSDGLILVGLRSSLEANVWLVLGHDGEIIGRFVLPQSAYLQAAAAGHVWATERDEFNVQSIVRYRVDGLHVQ